MDKSPTINFFKAVNLMLIQLCKQNLTKIKICATCTTCCVLRQGQNPRGKYCCVGCIC